MPHLRVETFQSQDVMPLKLFGAGSLPGLGQQLANGPPLLGQPVVPPNVCTASIHSASVRGRSFSRRLFAAFRLAGSPAYREAIDISCRTAYRSLPSVWYSIRFSISVNSIRIPPDSIHQKSHSIIPWLKNDNKKA